jgi:cell division protein FtsA
MTQKDQLIAAIDIGTTKIVAIVGRMNENRKLEVIGMSKTTSKGVKRGVVLNIEETVSSIQTVVEEIRNKTGINLSEVFVGIAGQHIRSIRNRTYINRTSFDDEITEDDIGKLVSDMYNSQIEAGEEIIHVLPQSFIVDNEAGVKNPIGMSGKRLEGNFHIVIGQISSARNMEKCVNRVGLNVKEMILEPLASSEAVLTEDEKEAGVALIDIGGGTTDLAVYYDNVIYHTAVIPFGGNVITHDIKEGCSILGRQAEQLKIQFGSALGDLAQEDKVVTIPGISGRDPKEISFRSLAYIIQSRMEEILDHVIYEIETSGVADKLSAGIVLTGGGALLRHLPQLVKFKTGYDVRVGFPNEHLAAESIEEANQPMFSTSIGLLLKGYESKQKVKEGKIEVKIETPAGKNKEPQTKFKPKIFIAIKEKLNEIFEEDDTAL